MSNDKRLENEPNIAHSDELARQKEAENRDAEKPGEDAESVKAKAARKAQTAAITGMPPN